MQPAVSPTSSYLLQKLENVKWSYKIDTQLQGLRTSLLVKYVIEQNAYAILLSDFMHTYFGCMQDEQLTTHYNRYNRYKRTQEEILMCLSKLLINLRECDTLKIDKLAVDCHTNRLTLKTSKEFGNSQFNWTFYLISTEQEVFWIHLMKPLCSNAVSLYRKSTNDKTTTDLDNNSSVSQETTTSYHILCNLDDEDVSSLFA